MQTNCLQHTEYPVNHDLRKMINGGIFSTFNVLPMHTTIEQWFDSGNFCVMVGSLFVPVQHNNIHVVLMHSIWVSCAYQAQYFVVFVCYLFFPCVLSQDSGEICIDDRLSPAEVGAMAQLLPSVVSVRIHKCEPLMAAFKWHRDNVFRFPGGVRGMFGGNSSSSAKGSSAGGSQRGSHTKEEGGSEASGDNSSEGQPPNQHNAGPSLPSSSASSLAILHSIHGSSGLSIREKVLLWDIGEAETVCAQDDHLHQLF
jgi:hypothetical protein